MVSSSPARSTLPSLIHWSRAACGKKTRFLPMGPKSVPCRTVPGRLAWHAAPARPISALRTELPRDPCTFSRLRRAFRASVAPEFTEPAALSLRDAFLQRTSSSMPQAGAQEPEERMRAAWDDALTRGGLARRSPTASRSRRASAGDESLSRAHRSVFRMSLLGRIALPSPWISSRRVPSLVLAARRHRPRGARARRGRSRRCAPLRGAHRGGDRRIAMLPGDHFPSPRRDIAHRRYLEGGRKAGDVLADLCDALLRMQHTFATCLV